MGQRYTDCPGLTPLRCLFTVTAYTSFVAFLQTAHSSMPCLVGSFVVWSHVQALGASKLTEGFPMSFASLFKSSTQEVSPNGSASNARSAAVLPIFLNKDAAFKMGRSVDRARNRLISSAAQACNRRSRSSSDKLVKALGKSGVSRISHPLARWRSGQSRSW